MTAISIDKLTKRFGEVVAVDSVSLEIATGSLFFLLGPSGCGKSTLLRAIAGLVEPEAGSIRFDGQDVTRMPANRRLAAMVFQSYALWPHMTVHENVAFGLKVNRVGSEVRIKRVAEALRSVRLEQLAERRPGELSGGQQQRVAVARALVVKPRVLLLDEPLSNLDARLRLEMRGEITRICRETGITTIYVTHDQAEALAMATNIAVLNEGRVIQIGTPRALYTRPESRFVASFIGEANFLTGSVVGRAGSGGHAVILDTAAGRLRATAPSGQAEGEITCCVRPEALRFVEPDAAAENTLPGRLLETTYLGHAAQHSIALHGGDVIKVLEVNPTRERKACEVRVAVAEEDVVIL